MGLQVHNTGFLAVSPFFRNGGIALIVTGIVVACISFLYRLIQDKHLMDELCKDLSPERLRDLFAGNEWREPLKTFNPMMKGDRDRLKNIRSQFTDYLLKLMKNGEDMHLHELDFIISQVKFFDEKKGCNLIVELSFYILIPPHEPLQWEKSLLLVAQSCFSKITKTQVEEKVTDPTTSHKDKMDYIVLIRNLGRICSVDAEWPPCGVKKISTIKEDVISYYKQAIDALEDVEKDRLKEIFDKYIKDFF